MAAAQRTLILTLPYPYPYTIAASFAWVAAALLLRSEMLLRASTTLRASDWRPVESRPCLMFGLPVRRAPSWRGGSRPGSPSASHTVAPRTPGGISRSRTCSGLGSGSGCGFGFGFGFGLGLAHPWVADEGGPSEPIGWVACE